MTTVTTASPTPPLADLTFRVLFSLIFVGAGLMHLVRPGELIARLLDAPLAWMATAVGPPHLLMVVTGLIMLPAGLGLMLGFWTRLSAVVLIALLIPITVVIDLGHTQNMGPLFKNIALFGGLIHFAARGPGAYALDNPGRCVAPGAIEEAGL
jgi:putative oxidoreductase